jgi:hypothetical protein
MRRADVSLGAAGHPKIQWWRMTSLSSQLRSLATAPVATSRYVGEIVYVYAFDVAYEMVRKPVTELLGQPVAQFVVDASKRSPRQLFFYRPQMVRLPALERIGPRGPLRLERTVKLLPVGAISVTVRIPFEVDKLQDLVAFHDLRFNDGTYLYDQVVQLAEDVRRELAAYYVRPVAQLANEEAYTVFCIDSKRSTFPASDAQLNNSDEATERRSYEGTGLLPSVAPSLRRFFHPFSHRGVVQRPPPRDRRAAH